MNEYMRIMENALANVRMARTGAEQDLERAKQGLKDKVAHDVYDVHELHSATESIRNAKAHFNEMDILLNNLESIHDKMLLEAREEAKEKKLVIFLHDGVIEGGFTNDDSVSVTMCEFDSDLDDKDAENRFWNECQQRGMKSFQPDIYHPSADEGDGDDDHA